FKIIELLLFVSAIIKVLERAYAESPSCAGNRTATYLLNTRGFSCETLYLPSINDNTTDSFNCSLIKDTKDCETGYTESLCGNLYVWLLDRFWLATAEEFYPECVSYLESEMSPLPPSPAS
ncbi:hypothetical protein EGW08_011571, partial [Elysia chlorotica]